MSKIAKMCLRFRENCIELRKAYHIYHFSAKNYDYYYSRKIIKSQRNTLLWRRCPYESASAKWIRSSPRHSIWNREKCTKNRLRKSLNMPKVETIFEHKDVAKYIISRGLLKQYQKAKRLLISWYTDLVDFKIRQPKEKWYYQFRINRQYRAFCYFENDDTLSIFEISDHQDF